MKKLISLIIAVAVVLSFCGCEGKVEGESTLGTAAETVTQQSGAVSADILDYAEESHKKGYALVKTIRMSKEELVFAYEKIDESKTFADDIVTYFEVYNIKENKITAKSEKYPFIHAAVSDLRSFNAGFYLHNSETVFVFNKQCELIKEIPMPRKQEPVWRITPYILSADGERCIYRPHHDWYVSNVDGTGERLIFEEHPKIAASEVFSPLTQAYLHTPGKRCRRVKVMEKIAMVIAISK